jgi:DNA invertase Pin-like site-specific DNA recombinase
MVDRRQYGAPLGATPHTYRTDGQPRGIETVSARQREGVAMLRAGATKDEVAAKFGIAKGTLHRWVERVRNWEQDQVNREVLANGDDKMLPSR